jgi:hypothetical protein
LIQAVSASRGGSGGLLTSELSDVGAEVDDIVDVVADTLDALPERLAQVDGELGWPLRLLLKCADLGHIHQ